MSLVELDESVSARSETSLIAELQAELRSYYEAIRQFSSRDISEVLMALAAFNGRASEIRSGLVANESRRVANFRTKQLEPFMECLEFQFKVFSRMQSVRQMEADFTRGGYT